MSNSDGAYYASLLMGLGIEPQKFPSGNVEYHGMEVARESRVPLRDEELRQQEEAKCLAAMLRGVKDAVEERTRRNDSLSTLFRCEKMPEGAKVEFPLEVLQNGWRDQETSNVGSVRADARTVGEGDRTEGLGADLGRAASVAVSGRPDADTEGFAIGTHVATRNEIE